MRPPPHNETTHADHKEPDERRPADVQLPRQRLAVSAEELAELLGVSRAHIFRMMSSGRLPSPIRLGRVVRWSRATIDGWLAAGAPPRDRWEQMRGDKHRAN
ncbi:MAG: helix-turn-helix transcriptional regulator [Phycisphaerales bacterium]